MRVENATAGVGSHGGGDQHRGGGRLTTASVEKAAGGVKVAGCHQGGGRRNVSEGGESRDSGEIGT
ncbi:hypothetical protein [Parafrankia sp. FMc2]|uniref:hypothetical protein n=1 Tax=Parafrankia sp. FMc2 TaxID=3233196 RepID=UPI0034D4BD4D